MIMAGVEREVSFGGRKENVQKRDLNFFHTRFL